MRRNRGSAGPAHLGRSDAIFALLWEPLACCIGSASVAARRGREILIWTKVPKGNMVSIGDRVHKGSYPRGLSSPFREISCGSVSGGRPSPRFGGSMSSFLGSSHTRIGQRIRELRIQNSLSLRELAGKARLKPRYISRVEDGREIPDCGTLRVLAGALSVPLYRLFCAGEEPLPTPRLTPRPTLDELIVEGCVRSKANSVFGAMYTMVLNRIEMGLHKVMPSFAGQRSTNSTMRRTDERVQDLRL